MANRGELLPSIASVDGYSPYLIGDLGYPLLPWLMIPHRGRQLSVSEILFNRKLRSGRCVVENAFGILKHTFRELLLKSDLHLGFLPDVVLACAILHNVILGQAPEEVEDFLNMLRCEGLDNGSATVTETEVTPAVPDDTGDNNVSTVSRQKRHDLRVYLTIRRRGGHRMWLVIPALLSAIQFKSYRKTLSCLVQFFYFFIF